MRLNRIFALTGVVALAGCHSAHIDATLSNRTDQPLSLVELDYPSASFGTQTLAPGAEFHYQFKVLGSGPATALWTDAAGRDHKSTGPTLKESDEGQLTVAFNPGGLVWDEQFTAKVH